MLDQVISWLASVRSWPHKIAAFTTFALVVIVFWYHKNLDLELTLVQPHLWYREAAVFIVAAVLFALLPRVRSSAGATRQQRRRAAEPRGVSNRQLSAMCLGAALGLALTGSVVSKLPFLATDRVVVAVARFRPMSQSVAEQADRYRDNLVGTLRARTGNERILRIKSLKDPIPGVDEESEAAVVALLGRTRTAAAHIVIWGEMGSDEGRLYVHPRLTVVRRHPRAVFPSGLLSLADTSGTHGAMTFRRSSPERFADIVQYVIGLGYRLQGNYDESIRVLSRGGSDETRSQLGYALLERAELWMADPVPDLLRAIASFEGVSGPKPWSSSAAGVDHLTLAAASGRASALLRLGYGPGTAHVPNRDRVEALRQAAQGFGALERVLAARGDDSWRREALLLRAAALGTIYDLAEEANEKGDHELLREVLRICGQMTAQSFVPAGGVEIVTRIAEVRAGALSRLGRDTPGPTGERYLREAISVAESAVGTASMLPSPISEALLHQSLGRSYEALGDRVTGPRRIELLRSALRHYRAEYGVAARPPLGSAHDKRVTLLRVERLEKKISLNMRVR